MSRKEDTEVSHLDKFGSDGHPPHVPLRLQSTTSSHLRRRDGNSHTFLLMECEGNVISMKSSVDITQMKICCLVLLVLSGIPLSSAFRILVAFLCLYFVLLSLRLQFQAPVDQESDRCQLDICCHSSPRTVRA